MARENNTTRMVAAERDMDKASRNGDRQAFNRAFSVFDRVRSQSSTDEYLNLYLELREDD